MSLRTTALQPQKRARPLHVIARTHLGRNVVHFTRAWRCASLPGLWMSLRGAKRRGNPYSLRQRKTKSSTLGESEVVYEFALSATFPYLSLRGRGLPRRFAPRNDMLKEGRVRGGKNVARNDMQKLDRHWTGICVATQWFAMTCKRLPRCYVCKRVPPGQARNRPRIRLKCYFSLPFSAGPGIAASLRSSQ